MALGSVILTEPPSAAAAVNSACPVNRGVLCADTGKTGVRCPTAGGDETFAGIDEYCLSCHGGPAAPRRLCAGVRPTPHSSAIPYPTGTRDLRPLSALDPRLKLRGGRVTCETCHGGRDPAASYLSIPVASSALCLACHLK
jgi:hypothetical protein